MGNNAAVPRCKTFHEAVEGKFGGPNQNPNVDELWMA